MTDRELLELAAKAAGLPHQFNPFWGGFYVQRGDGDWNSSSLWNPLTNDGDALRLAVQLDIDVAPNIAGQANAGDMWEFHCDNSGDPYAATRRVIVRAAAEIGRSKT